MKDTNLTGSDSSHLFKKTTDHWLRLQACLLLSLSQRSLPPCGLPAGHQGHAAGLCRRGPSRQRPASVCHRCVETEPPPQGSRVSGTQPGLSTCRRSLGSACRILPSALFQSPWSPVWFGDGGGGPGEISVRKGQSHFSIICEVVKRPLSRFLH